MIKGQHVVTIYGIEGVIVDVRNRYEMDFLYAGFGHKELPRNNVCIQTERMGKMWIPEHELSLDETTRT